MIKIRLSGALEKQDSSFRNGEEGKLLDDCVEAFRTNKNRITLFEGWTKVRKVNWWCIRLLETDIVRDLWGIIDLETMEGG